MIWLKLFWDFFKVSCFTFGGAYGAIPLIRDMVLQNGWLSDEQISYMIAISESTPGPIMVNMATNIGYQQAGFWGSLLATFAVVLPAYLVIMLVMGILKHTLKNPAVQAVLRGLKPCVVGIVLATGLYMVIHNCITFSGGITADLRSGIVTVLLGAIVIFFPMLTKKRVSSIALICISAVLGMIVFGI